VGCDKKESQGFRVVLFQDFPDGKKIAQGLAHLFRVDIDEPVVQPVFDERLAGSGLGLGDLVLVVGKHKILSAAMDVDGFAEETHAHGGALDVPAGATLAPRRVPGRLARLCLLPEYEVHGMSLPFINLDARAGLHVVQAPFRELQVVIVFFNAEVDVSAGLVGDTPIHKGTDDVDDIIDVFRRFRLMGRNGHAQQPHVAVELTDEPFRNLPEIHTLAVGAVDDLVVHIRVVSYVGHLISGVAKVAVDNVEDYVRPCMANVAMVVDGDSADIHGNLARDLGNELFLFSGKGVEDS